MKEMNHSQLDHSAFTSKAGPAAVVDVGIRAMLLLSVGLAIFAVPLGNLFHPSPWQRGIGFWHSSLAFLATGLNVAVGLLLFALLKRTLSVRVALVLSAFSGMATLLSVLSGVVAYARYRAPVSDAAGVYMKVVSPLMEVAMVWHQLTSLGLLGLTAAVYFCLWVYGKHLLKSDYHYGQIRDTLAVCLGLILFFAVTETMVGAALAKVHAL